MYFFLKTMNSSFLMVKDMGWITWNLHSCWLNHPTCLLFWGVNSLFLPFRLLQRCRKCPSEAWAALVLLDIFHIFSYFFLSTVLFVANLFLMIGPSPWDPEIFQPRWSHLPRIGRWIWQDLPAPALNSERVQRSSLVVGWLFDFRLWPSGQIS